MRLRNLLIASLLLPAAGAVQADPVDLKPFRATYTVEWKGMTAGTSVLELRASGTDTYQYSNTSSPRGMFRMALPDSILQTSTFRIVGGRVQPLEFGGADEKERPVKLEFDWTRKRVSGTARDHSVDLELPEGAQDPMSLQIASLRDLAAGKMQDSVWIIDGDKLKEYQLRQEGKVQLETGLGTLDTIVYTSRRASGDRVTRTWVAPALGYLPVKAERIRGKKVEFTIEIESLDR
jgi:hypothetical protein